MLANQRSRRGCVATGRRQLRRHALQQLETREMLAAEAIAIVHPTSDSSIRSDSLGMGFEVANVGGTLVADHVRTANLNFRLPDIPPDLAHAELVVHSRVSELGTPVVQEATLAGLSEPLAQWIVRHTESRKTHISFTDLIDAARNLGDVDFDGSRDIVGDMDAFDLAISDPEAFRERFDLDTDENGALLRVGRSARYGSAKPINSSDLQTVLDAHGYVAGDLNFDHVVDAADFSILFGNWSIGSPYPDLGYRDGDINFDRVIDAADAAVLSSHLNAFPTQPWDPATAEVILSSPESKGDGTRAWYADGLAAPQLRLWQNNKMLRVRLEARVGDRAVRAVPPGQEFTLVLLVEDLREPAAQGINKLSLDLRFDPSKVSADWNSISSSGGVTIHRPASPYRGPLNESTIGFSSSVAAGVSGEFPVLSVTMMPHTIGPVDLHLDAADTPVHRGTRMRGDFRDLEPEQIQWQGLQLEVNPSGVAYGTSSNFTSRPTPRAAPLPTRLYTSWQNRKNPFDAQPDGIPRSIDAAAANLGPTDATDPLTRALQRDKTDLDPFYIDVDGDGYASEQDAALIVEMLPRIHPQYPDPPPPEHLLKGDFDGDGYSDLLRYVFTHGTGTRAAVTRWLHDGSTVTDEIFQGASTYFAWDNVLVGDWNGDGSDDLAARTQFSSEWTLALSAPYHASDRSSTSAYWGTWDGAHTGRFYVGDFDGDQKDDIAYFGNQTVHVAISEIHNPSVERWTAEGIFSVQDAKVGDFNGDGRDDLLVYNQLDGWQLLVSNGSSFFRAGAVQIPWYQTYVGDFAPEPGQELLIWNGTWDLLGFRDSRLRYITSLTATGSNSLGLVRPPELMDVNDDGFTDLVYTDGQSVVIAYVNSPELPSTIHFQDSGDYFHPWIWKQDGLTAVHARRYIDVILREYGSVYNHVAPQSYVGYMKGPDATWRTRAGNDWDQSALLARNLDQNKLPSQLLDTIIEVDGKPVQRTMTQVLTPGVQGMQWLSLDVSTKDIVSSDGIPGILETVPFHDVDYFNRDLGNIRGETPLEHYEDRLNTYLKPLGKTVADVPRRTRTARRTFASLADLPSVAPPLSYATYPSPDSIPDEARHRIRIALVKDGATASEYTTWIDVPSENQTPIAFFPLDDDTGGTEYVLQVGDTIRSSSIPQDHPIMIRIENFNPGTARHEGPDAISRYYESSSSVVTVGMNALQYTDDIVSEWGATIHDEVARLQGTQPQNPLGVIRNTHQYVLGRYWSEFTRQGEFINSLFHTDTHYPGVSAGIARSRSGVLFNESGNYFWDLTFPAIPAELAIDLKHSLLQPIYPDGRSPFASNLEKGPHLDLLGHNASALEHSIVEEVSNAQSVSTIRAIEVAIDRNVPVYRLTSTPNRLTVAITSLNGGERIAHYGATIPEARGFFENLIPYEYPHSPTLINSLLNRLFRQETDPLHLDELTLPAMRTTLPEWQGSAYIADSVGEATDGLFTYAISGEFGFMNGGYLANFPAPAPPVPHANTTVVSTFAGDPVNVANGNVTFDSTQIQLPSSASNMTFALHYDSQSTRNVGFGLGWSHSFSDHLEFHPDAITWHTETGQQHRFEDDNGVYLRPSSLNSSGGSLRTESYGYVYVNKHAAEIRFDHTGRLIAKLDRNLNGITITYHDSTPSPVKLARITDTRDPNNYIHFSGHAGLGLITVQVAGGAEWTYDVTDSEGSHLRSLVAPSPTGTNITTFTYHLDPADTRFDLLKRVTDANGLWHEYEYYPNRRGARVIAGDDRGPRSQQIFRYNLHRNMTTFIDERGGHTEYFHDNQGLLLRETLADRSRESFTWGVGTSQYLMTSFTNAANHTTLYEYYTPSNVGNDNGATGNLKRTIAPNGLETHFTYGDFSNIAASTLRFGSETRETRFAYDTAGNLTSVRDPLGNTTTMAYNQWGQLDSRTSANENSLDGSRDHTTTFLRNKTGQITQQAQVHRQLISDDFSRRTTGGSLADWDHWGIGAIPWESEHLHLDAASGPFELAHKAAIASDRYRVQASVSFSSFTDRSTFSLLAGHQGNTSLPRLAFRVTRDSTSTSAQFLFGDALPSSTRLETPHLGSNSRHTIELEVIGRQAYGWINGQLVAAAFAPLGFGSGRTGMELSKATSTGAIEVDDFSVAELSVIRTRYHGGLGDSAVSMSIDPHRNANTFERELAGQPRKIHTAHGIAHEDDFDSTELSSSWTHANGTWAQQSGALLLTGSNQGTGRLIHQAPTSSAIFRLESTVIFAESSDPSDTLVGAGSGLVTHYSPLLDYTHAFEVYVARKQGNDYILAYRVNIGFNNQETLELGEWPLPLVPHAEYELALEVHDDRMIGYIDGVPVAEYLKDGSIRGQSGLSTTLAASMPVETVQVTRYRHTDLATTRLTHRVTGETDSSTDPLGFVTRHTFDSKRRPAATRDPDGTGTAIDYDELGNIVSTIDQTGVKTRYFHDLRSRLATVLLPDGAREESFHDATNHIVQSLDARGRATHYTYDNMGRLLTTVNALDETIRNRYDAFGQLTSTQDGRGFVTLYRHDHVGRLVLETRPKAGVFDELGDFHIDEGLYDATSYAYDSDGNRTQRSEYDVHVVNPWTIPDLSTIASDHRRVFFTDYDAQGRLIGTRNPLQYLDEHRTYDVSGRLTSEVLPNHSSATEYAYDAAGRLVETLQPSPSDEHTLEGVLNRTTTRYAYDKQGNPIYSWVGSLGDVEEGSGRFRETMYDWAGRPTAIIDALGHKSVTRYDATGSAVVSIDALARASRTDFDHAGRPVRFVSPDPDLSGSHTPSITHAVYDVAGNVIATSDPAGHITEYQYDALNRLAQEAFPDPDGNLLLPRLVTEYRYDAAGNQTDTIQFANSQSVITRTQFDGVGKVTRIIADFGGEHLTAQFLHDGYGQLDREITHRGTVTRYTYNRAGIRTGRTLASGDVNEVQETYLIDDRGNLSMLRTESDSVNIRQHFRDQLGRIERSTHTQGIASTDVTFRYDAFGNLRETSTINALPADLDASGTESELVTTLIYDPLDRLITTLDANQGVTQRTYDAAGNLLSLKDPEGNRTRFSYDLLGRQVTAEQVGIGKQFFVYDQSGNLQREVSREGRQILREFDRLNRLTGVSSAEHTGSGISLVTQRETWVYDAEGRIAETHVGGHENDFDRIESTRYDRLGRPEEISIRDRFLSNPTTNDDVRYSFQYDDEAGTVRRAEHSDTAAYVQISTLDPLGRVTRIDYGRIGALNRDTFDHSALIQYNDFGLFEQVKQVRTDGSTILSSDFDINSLGQTLQIDHRVSGGTLQLSHLYDRASRLVQRDLNEGAQSLHYDAIGQLVGATGARFEEYAYTPNGNRADHLIGPHNRIVTAAQGRFEYDRDGNLTSIDTEDTFTEFEWDYRGRLSSVRRSPSQTELPTETFWYRYDASGMVSHKFRGTQQQVLAQTYVYDEHDNLSLRYEAGRHADGNASHRYLYGPATDQLFAEYRLAQDTSGIASSITFALTDHAGTVIGLRTTPSVHVALPATGPRLQYDAFGNRLDSEATDFLFGFGGRMWDDDLQLWRTRARWYDSRIGRFLNEDPAGFGGGDTNLYRYAFNNPISLVDPSGLRPALPMITSHTTPAQLFDTTGLGLGNPLAGALPWSQESTTDLGIGFNVGNAFPSDVSLFGPSSTFLNGTADLSAARGLVIPSVVRGGDPLFAAKRYLDANYAFSTRFFGAMQGAAGVAQVGMGTAIFTASGIATGGTAGTALPVTLATGAFGGVVAAKGIDDLMAGSRTLFTGTTHRTITSQMLDHVTGDPAYSELTDHASSFILIGGAGWLRSSRLAKTTSAVTYSGVGRNTSPASTATTSRGAILRQEYAHYTGIQRRFRISELATGNRVLREANVPQQYIGRTLQSFEPGTIQAHTIGTHEFGLRFYGGVAGPKSPFLAPTFPNDTVRRSLAIPAQNSMEHLIQFQIRPGTKVLRGRVRGNFGQPGGGEQIFVPDFQNNLLSPK